MLQFMQIPSLKQIVFQNKLYASHLWLHVDRPCVAADVEKY
jgi:hypothetical protein